MKSRLSLTLLGLVVVLCAIRVPAQDAGNAVQIENLRAQLRDVTAREADYKIRLDQLNWDLKPENIERYFSGVGSTRPEELREARRRQLQTEKDAIVAQLEQLESSRMRLEGAIQVAETQAYQQGTIGKASLLVQRAWGGHRVLVLTGIVLVAALVGMLVLIPLVRARSRRL